ncbi:unnamed protein product [Echinostoma caproni]|uniref:Secreted protein n=1 Tax=Echinostoma caproni TaxID=27848 RepID=A0A183AFI6_9TREM|nr:unnamed protein product [Echinostoma caproni]
MLVFQCASMTIMRQKIILLTVFYWILCTNISQIYADLLLDERVCTVTEESPIGTVVCDLETLWDKIGVPFSLPTRPVNPIAGSVANKSPVQITVINEAKTFVVVGTQIVSRDRIDREQYVLTKHCRSTRSNGHGMTTDGNELGE